MQVKLYLGLLRVSIKILLLEDDLLFGETIVDLLEDAGYEVIHVPNGQDALDLTYNKRFGLYLLDINVPLIDGLSLLKELREADDNTPAIFLTSHTEKSKLQEGFVSGCDDYLSKPFDMDELLFRIKALMRRSKGKSRLCINELCLDDKHKSVTYRDKEIRLSVKEYQLLKLLMSNKNDDTILKKVSDLKDLEGI
jgi:DNA-binding response OmpR family regulator